MFVFGVLAQITKSLAKIIQYLPQYLLNSSLGTTMISLSMR